MSRGGFHGESYINPTSCGRQIGRLGLEHMISSPRLLSFTHSASALDQPSASLLPPTASSMSFSPPPDPSSPLLSTPTPPTHTLPLFPPSPFSPPPTPLVPGPVESVNSKSQEITLLVSNHRWRRRNWGSLRIYGV